MSRRTVLLGSLLLALLLTGSIFSYQTRPPDLPPGVAPADWVKVSEDFGVQLTRNGSNQLLGLPPDYLHGTLYVKSEGKWHRFYLDPPNRGIRPLGQ